MQVVLSKEKKNWYFHLIGSVKKVGKYVGQGKRHSIAVAVVENTTLRREVVLVLGSEVGKEMKRLCSDENDSILRMTTKPALLQFTWKRVWDELQLDAPLMMSILTNFLPPSKKNDESLRPALCLCASIFLKLRNQKVNIAQNIISLVLKGGHATKQVC